MLKYFVAALVSGIASLLLGLAVATDGPAPVASATGPAVVEPSPPLAPTTTTTAPKPKSTATTTAPKPKSTATTTAPKHTATTTAPKATPTTTAPKTTSAPGGYQAGQFCSQSGATATSSAGKSLVCSADQNGKNRWTNR